MKRLSKYATSIVRMFPDYAGTVLWFMDPIRYEVTHLSANLVSELEAWEQCYNEGLTDDFTWRSDAAARRFTKDGRLLAQRVADELGRAFSVEFGLHGGWKKRRFRASGSPLNPEAAAAFTALADAAREEHEDIRRLLEGGAKLRWSVSAPGAGAVATSEDPEERPTR